MRVWIIELCGVIGFLGGLVLLGWGAFTVAAAPTVVGAILMVGSLLVCECVEEAETP